MLAQQEPDERVRVIVQLTGATAVEPLIVGLGGRFVRELALINAIVAELPAHVLTTLAGAPTVRHISLDAPVVKLSEAGDGLITVRDNFDLAAYVNNDGKARWASEWQEIGESDGPQTGNVTVPPFWGGALQGLRLQGTAQGAQRSADLSQASAATLSLSYRRKDYRSATDAATIAVSTDGGATWQSIAELTGPATDAEIQYGHKGKRLFKPPSIALRPWSAPMSAPSAPTDSGPKRLLISPAPA